MYNYAYTLPVYFIYFMYNKNILMGAVIEICSSQTAIDCRHFWHTFT
jgi:hypothetical protein